MQAEDVPIIEAEGENLTDVFRYGLTLFRKYFGRLVFYAVIFSVVIGFIWAILAGVAGAYDEGASAEDLQDFYQAFEVIFPLSIMNFWLCGIVAGRLFLSEMALRKPTRKQIRSFWFGGIWVLLLVSGASALRETFRAYDTAFATDLLLLLPDSVFDFALILLLTFVCANKWMVRHTQSAGLTARSYSPALLAKFFLVVAIMYGIPNLILGAILDGDLSLEGIGWVAANQQDTAISGVIEMLDGVLGILALAAGMLLYLGFLGVMAVALYLKHPDVHTQLGGIKDVFS